MSSAECQRSEDDQTTSLARYSILWISLKSIGSIIGKPGTLVRRISIQRAATVGSKTNVCQVIIKNTHALRDSTDYPTSDDLSVNRSQSLQSTNIRIPILAPKRTERVRMEHDLAKVWTKDLLPYPGMGGTRGDSLLRASASSMMRKISRASLTTGFSKRSASHTSIDSSRFTDMQGSLQSAVDMKNGYSSVLRVSSTSMDRMDQAKGLGTSDLHYIPPRRGSVSKTLTTLAQDIHDSEDSFQSVPTEIGEDNRVDGMTGEMPAKRSKARLGPLSLFKSLSTDGQRMFRSSKNSTA